MKELERGRLLFYVKFKDGVGYLDVEKFKSEVLSDECIDRFIYQASWN